MVSCFILRMCTRTKILFYTNVLDVVRPVHTSLLPIFRWTFLSSLFGLMQYKVCFVVSLKKMRLDCYVILHFCYEMVCIEHDKIRPMSNVFCEDRSVLKAGYFRARNCFNFIFNPLWYLLVLIKLHSSLWFKCSKNTPPSSIYMMCSIYTDGEGIFGACIRSFKPM